MRAVPIRVLEFTQQWQVGRYWSSHNDDYIDHSTHAQADMAFSQRAFGRVGVDYIASHDPRGSTDRGISQTPDQYKVFHPTRRSLSVRPARRPARGLLPVRRSALRQQPRVTQFSDRETQEYGAALYIRVAPKTYVLGEVRRTDIDYKITSRTARARRAITVAYSGKRRRHHRHAEVRTRQARFHVVAHADETDTSWEGMINWAPRTYSHVEFLTSRQTNEAERRRQLHPDRGLPGGVEPQLVVLSDYRRHGALAARRIPGLRPHGRHASLGLRVGYKFRPGSRWAPSTPTRIAIRTSTTTTTRTSTC
jgi:hypothetical protein